VLIAHHICIGYLSEKENITDKSSHFREYIDQWNTEDIEELISSFRSQREYLLVKESPGGQGNQL